jgi:AcrR family transcriptional regulator
MDDATDTSARILQAVIDGLQELDPAALTIQQVCRRADVKAPTVYYYFGNKDGLIAAGVDALVTQWVSQLDALVDRSGTLDQALAQAVTAWEFMITSAQRPFAVFVWVSMWSPGSRAALVRARAHAQDLIRAAVVEHLAAVADPDAIAGLLLDGVLGASVEYQLDSDRAALRKRLSTLVNMVRQGAVPGVEECV